MSQIPDDGETAFGSYDDALEPHPTSRPARRESSDYEDLIARVGEDATSAPKLPPPPTVPAGWYPDPENTTGFRYGGAPSMRYFDGVEWTEHRAPMQRQQRQPYPQQPIVITQQVGQPTPPIVVNNGSSSLVGLHLVLTIFTCGLWLPIWVIIEVIQAISRR